MHAAVDGLYAVNWEAHTLTIAQIASTSMTDATYWCFQQGKHDASLAHMHFRYVFDITRLILVSL